MASKFTAYSYTEYIETRVDKQANGCWVWKLAKDRYGYGKASYKGHRDPAHRQSYRAFNGDIAKGSLIQHTCDNPACVNPDHLVLGTWLSNMQDKVAKGRLRNQHMNKTHCKYGHEFTPENTAVYDNRRSCIICRHKKRGVKKPAGKRVHNIQVGYKDR